MGNVMGGAIFTLADFALAIACNIGEDPTVAVNNTIEYLNSTKGSTLIATQRSYLERAIDQLASAVEKRRTNL